MGGSKRAERQPNKGKPKSGNGRTKPGKLAEKDGRARQDKPLRPTACRTYLRRQLANSFPAIVRGFVKQAESGSVQHLKLTTELLEKPVKQRKGKGSALLLLEKLERMGPGDRSECETPTGAEAWPE